MLQIIGWLGCAMLAVKLLEIAANPAMRKEDGDLNIFAMYAVLIGWAAVLGFAFWLALQGGAFERGPSELDRITARADEAKRKADCMEAASPDLNAMLAC